MQTLATEVRQCMNCGRPQDHRWHQMDTFGWDGALSNGCRSAPQPEGLMAAVLWPAIRAAAEAHGVEWGQAHDAIWHYGQRA